MASRSGGNVQPMFDPYKTAEECDQDLLRCNLGESYTKLLELREKVRRLEMQRQAVIDLCDPEIARASSYSSFAKRVRAALGAG